MPPVRFLQTWTEQRPTAHRAGLRVVQLGCTSIQRITPVASTTTVSTSAFMSAYAARFRQHSPSPDIARTTAKLVAFVQQAVLR